MTSLIRYFTQVRYSLFDSICITMFVVALSNGRLGYALVWLLLGPLASIVLGRIASRGRKGPNNGP